MPLLIDAWNFIRSEISDINDDERDSLEAAQKLIAYMRKFQETHKDPVILVFDSKNEYLGIEYKNTADLSVVPAKNADDYIKRYIEKYPERQRRNLRVVSSDNSVYYNAKSMYAVPIKSEEFWVKLNNG